MNKIRKSNLLSLFVVALMFITMGPKAYGEDTLKRISGNDNCATSIEISKAGWSAGSSEYAVLVTGDNFPDALCASPLAKLLNAPIILLGKTSVDNSVLGELKRLGVKKAFLVGGTGVIPISAETILKQNSFEYERLYGSDRYGTSLDVAGYIADNTEKVDEVAIVTGENYPDALSIASIASLKEMPIILSEKSQLSQEFKDFIGKNGVAKSYIIGGTGVIGDDVLNNLPSPKRLGGADRYETNTLVLDYFLNSGEFDFSTTYLATGNDFPDALAGSVMAAKSSSPIVLLDKVSSQSTLDFVAKNRLLMKQMVVIGRQDVVSDSSIESLLPKIASISNMEVSVNEGDPYTLPEKVSAVMDNNTVKDVLVEWSANTVNTNAGTVYNFTGDVPGYNGSVYLKLNIMHPIIGKSLITAEKLAKFLTDTEPNPKINCTPLELAEMFIEEGEIEGVRGDIAFCQSIKETGWFRFNGKANWEWNNFSGLGVTGEIDPVTGEYKGLKFATPREGVRAQIQHLKAYSSLESLKMPLIDSRFSGVKRGRSPYWEWLGRDENPENLSRAADDRQGWAVPGTTYGHDIISLYYEKLKNL